VSNEFFEAAIEKHTGDEAGGILLKLGDQLLHLIGRFVPDPSAKRALALRNGVAEWRSLLRTGQSPAVLRTVVDRILLDGQTLLEKMQADRADREAELADLMRVLRESVDTLRGDARKFEADLERSTASMDAIVEIQDIRELKRQLSREVQVIRQAVTRREQSETQHCERLTARIESLQQSLKAARAHAATDSLTQLPDRRAFDLALREWIARAARTNEPFTAAIVDLDDLKLINDTHGHEVGDRVLVAAGQLLADCLDEHEIAARWGGDEFALLFATPSTGRARDRLTEVLGRISPAYEYEAGGERRMVSFSFSAGATAWAEGDTPDTILRRADKALSTAKRLGKRRVEARSRSFLRALVS